MAAMNGAALFLKDLGFVVAFGGAVLGSGLVYIMPALMFIKATQQKEVALKKVGLALSKGRRREMRANMLLAAMGVGLSGLGGYMSLVKYGFV